jgi:signal peptidase I
LTRPRLLGSLDPVKKQAMVEGEKGSLTPFRSSVGATIVAALLLTPVGGYLALARWRRALAFMLAQSVLGALAIFAILHRVPWAAGACALLAVASYVAAVLDVGRQARRTPTKRRHWPLALAAVPVVAGFFGGVQPVQAHVIGSFRTIGTMLPTLTAGDRVFIDKRRYAPRRGEVVVFRFPAAPAPEYVQRAKRVVALAGDKVELRAGSLLVNGTAIPARQLDSVVIPAANVHVRRPDDQYQEWEETLEGRTYRVFRVSGGERSSFGPVTVPPGHFFMLGDNRDNNNDSRLYGPIPVDSIVGRALWIWWSTQLEGGIQWNRLGQRL